MITNSDIAKLAKVLATKEDIYTLDMRLKRVEDSLNSVCTTIDNLSHQTSELKTEVKVVKHHLNLT